MEPTTVRYSTPEQVTADESGATLVIALIFVILGSLTVLALTNLAGNDLLNTANLQGQRSLEYAADGAVEGAIQSLRYQFAGVPGVACPSWSANQNVNNVAVRVDCAPLSAGPSQREVQFTVCLASAPSPCPSTQAIVTTKIHYYDIEFDELTLKQGWSLAVDSWVVYGAGHG